MKTYDELLKENADLTELLRKVTNQLNLALNDVARNHAAKMKPNRGQSHHRAFERLCPMPPMPDMSDLVTFEYFDNLTENTLPCNAKPLQ